MFLFQPAALLHPTRWRLKLQGHLTAENRSRVSASLHLLVESFLLDYLHLICFYFSILPKVLVIGWIYFSSGANATYSSSGANAK